MAVALPKLVDKRPVAKQDVDVQHIGENMRVGIGLFSAWMIGVGSIIGSMAWLFHGYMIASAGPLASICAWLAAALVYVPVTLILAELSSMFPAAGGPYLYKYYAFKRVWPGAGELFGFLTGWLFWASLLVALGCMSNGLCNLLSVTFYGSTQASPLWFGPLIITVLFVGTTAINLMDVGRTAAFNNAFTILKFALAIGFGALVASAPTSSIANVLNPANLKGDANLLVNMCGVLAIAIGGFGGIELIACTSSETKKATKSVPIAMFLTLASVTIIYAGMCAAVSAASSFQLNPDSSMAVVPGTTIPATVPGVTGLLAGEFWGRIATFAVISSIVGCGIGALLACARLGYSMARTGLFPTQFGHLNEKTKVPSYSVKFQCATLLIIGIGANIMSRVGVFPDAYSFLAETFCFMYLLILALYGVSLIILRYTDKTMERPFRIGAQGNWLAWLMVVASVATFGFVAFFCTKAIYQIAGAVVLLSGIPVYAFYRWRK